MIYGVLFLQTFLGFTNKMSSQNAHGLWRYSITICSQSIKQISHHSQSLMVTLLMNLRSVSSEGVFVFIKSLANVTLMRLRPLVNSHYVSGSGAGSGEQFGAQLTL